MRTIEDIPFIPSCSLNRDQRDIAEMEKKYHGSICREPQVDGQGMVHGNEAPGAIRQKSTHSKRKRTSLVYWRNVVKAIFRSEVANNPEHTCWLCPRTLRQLVRRHSMEVAEVSFGSRYLPDRVMPLPKGVKHTSIHVVVMEADYVTR